MTSREQELKGPFFRARELLRGQIPRVDAHIHTALTDGRGSLEDYVLQARELGLHAIAFTEHADDTSTWFEEYVASKDRLQKLAGPVRVYFAAEVKLIRADGALALNPRKIQMLDFVVGVIHRYPDETGNFRPFDTLSPEEAMDMDYRFSLALLSNPLMDVLGHLGGLYSFKFGTYDEAKLKALIVAAASRGRVVEINTNPRYRDAFKPILDTCLDLDCMVSIGSDAHDPSELGHAVRFLRDELK